MNHAGLLVILTPIIFFLPVLMIYLNCSDKKYWEDRKRKRWHLP